MSLIYGLKDKPSFGKLLIFALQQLLAISAGTIALPLIVGNGMSQSAALFGACVGTLIYMCITKFRSPVFLGSSFTYLGSMIAAFSGAATFGLAHEVGFLGIFIGAVLAGLVYVILSIVVHFVGTNWISKVMPPVIIGPVVALIGLTLAPNAIRNLGVGNVLNEAGVPVASTLICILIGVITLFATITCSVHAKSFIKLIPFVIGIFVGYVFAVGFTLIGNAANVDALKVVNFEPLKTIRWIPDFTFLHFGDAVRSFPNSASFWKYTLYIFSMYVPIAFAVFAEHIADHKNLSTIIGQDLLVDPGLSHTLMGDGVGSFVGALFGGCPNTTYGESISCVAYSRNASIVTVIAACVMGIAVSFVGPVMSVIQTIPNCIVGGLSIALYGYIASSGLKMLKDVNLNDHRNVFVISTVFVVGIGGLAISYVYGEISPIACALILGIAVNILVRIGSKKKTGNANNIEKSSENPDNFENHGQN